MAVDGVATVAFAQVPVRFERFYDDYEVVGDSAPPPEPDPAPRDSARARCERLGKEIHCSCRRGRCRAFTVVIPPDSAALLASADLPPRLILGETDSLVTEGELRELGQRLGALPATPWGFRVPRPRWGLARYNRVEGLSLGARVTAELGRLTVDATGRLGLANLEPDADLALRRESGTARWRLAGYYRLAAADPGTRPLGVGNSLASLLLGRDDGEYFRASGVELRAAPAATLAQNVELRLYGERQRAVSKETDFSLPHAFDRDHRFRPNITARAAEQLGVAMTVRGSRRVGSDAATLGAEVTVEGSAGTFGFGRAALTVHATAPLPRGLVLGVETAGGTSAGRVPLQSRWFLGGPATLRGYPGGALSGEAFWRARGEVANAFPGARLALYTDEGSAGPRDGPGFPRPLWSAGLGASFLDGLIRIDCSRALRAPVGWRVDFYADGIL